jgi:1-aminocyclopropane-1-carboxylate synthase
MLLSQVVAGIVPFAVHMSNPTAGPTESELDMGFMQARSRGLNPRFVLMTNPNNPLGVIYSPEIIKKLVRWARKRNLHTIMDELYALSTHQKTGHNFQSVIRVLDNQLGNDVHFVWSVSKDFGASGLRVGFVYSQNATYIQGLANLNIFSGVSNPIQMVVSELLTDDEFVDIYLDASRERLKESYIICVEKLEEMVVPFIPAEAGMFVYVDFSSLLPEKTMEWEAKLSQLLVDYARLILTPGESQRERMPGMFRICYAWVSPEVLKIGMERLSRIVAKIRRMDWGDLNEITLSGVL